MSNTLQRLLFLLAFVISALPSYTETPKSGKPRAAELGHGANAVLWQDPIDITSRNLFYGSGGEDHQPRGPFTFIQEDLQGSNPKFDVRDRDGVKWKVKLGPEVHAEVAASRLVWAAGYFTTEDYFVPELHVQGLPPHLHRGQNLVGPDGTVHNARLKRSIKGQEKIKTWQWGSNPFEGTREFNGLRVLMALINNWDLKDSNNAVYEEKHRDESGDPKETYLVSDLGASFGPTGFTLSNEASRGNLEAYQRSKFITDCTSDDVDFATPSTPALIETFNLPIFIRRVDLRWIGRDIPLADAKWMGQLLGRLSPEQIRDAFRAAGYSDPEANGFASVVQGRIAKLKTL